ncbi:MAG: hypothetical protein D6743_03205 [Calditrichaeota bacterium]|nr:MAG: hypothetical protein D6743_03205 [Calditrichota bacterium]
MKRMQKVLCVALSLGFFWLIAGPSALAQEKDKVKELEEEFSEFENQKPSLPDFTSEEYKFLDFGVKQDYMKMERFRTRNQILTFIPPLYQPAFVGHGYVLPPNTWRAAMHVQSIDVNSSDFFKHGEVDPVHQNHSVERLKYDLDFFYGLDHDMTLRVNVPIWATRSTGAVHPAGVAPLNLYVEGTTTRLGDISVFLKKKFFDQGNRWFNFAGVFGVILPTGSNDEKFDDRLIMTSPANPNGVVAFGGGPFQRFSDDGRLPTVLQPGIGRLGLIFALMGTKQFSRSAFHAGSLVRLNDLGANDDDIKNGNEVFYFASYVLPVGTDKLSLELAFNGKWKGKDHYPGTFMHPMTADPSGFGPPIMEMDPNTGQMKVKMFNTPRPPFSGGWVGFLTPSVILNPYSQLRFEFSTLIRVIKPDLGPAPKLMLRGGITTTF